MLAIAIYLKSRELFAKSHSNAFGQQERKVNGGLTPTSVKQVGQSSRYVLIELLSESGCGCCLFDLKISGARQKKALP